MIKVVYAFFVGLLLAIFVGVGISTFYPEPTAPKSPEIFTRSSIEASDVEYAEQASIYQEASTQYALEVSNYNRSVSIIALVAAVIFMGVGLAFASRIHILSDGLLLGGVFTLVYSLARGFMSDENIHRFLIVSIGLAVALLLGYLKFIKPEQKIAKKK